MRGTVEHVLLHHTYLLWHANTVDAHWIEVGRFASSPLRLVRPPLG